MLRGSTQLLQRSVKVFEDVIKHVSQCPKDHWEIDVDNYSTEAIETLLKERNKIRELLPSGSSDVFVSKLTLGVFGNVPAFDRNFNRSFGPCCFNEKTLASIADFYIDKADEIDRNRQFTLSLETGTDTSNLYPRAKVVDMVFFGAGKH